MTNKISIQFNEIEGEHLDVIKKLVEKPYEQLSQEDLMEIRVFVNMKNVAKGIKMNNNSS